MKENATVHPKPARRRALLAGAALMLALIAPTAGAGKAVAAPTARPAATAGRTGLGSQLRPLPLPGRSGGEYTVTLPTGDQIRLSRTAGGKYTVTTVPTPGASPLVSIRSTGDGKRTTSITALPMTATTLISSGRMDRQMFDVTWLMAHGDAGPNAKLPVTVRYGGRPSVAELTAKAATLPGAKVVATKGDTVSLTVPARHASAFWAALTGRTGKAADKPAWAVKADLAGGAVKAWLTGHQSTQASASADVPTHHVTITEKKTDAPPFLCNATLVTFCGGLPALELVSGVGADFFLPTGVACLDADPCDTLRFTYDVPTGIYSWEDFGSFYVKDNQIHSMEIARPQFTVAADTTMTVSANGCVPVSIGTPRPADVYSSGFESERDTADGSWESSVGLAGYGAVRFEAQPTTTPITVGTFHYSTVWELGRPPVTMSVSAPRPYALHPTYPEYANTLPTRWFARFKGRSRLPLVAAGYGTTDDLAQADVRGKLAFIRLHWGDGTADPDVLQNALDAGATGVVFDPIDYEAPGFDSPLPVDPLWWWPGHETTKVDIPFVAITSADAKELNGLLAKGPVSVDLADGGGTTPYLYNLRFNAEEKIPGSLRYSVTDRRLTAITTDIHDNPEPDINLYLGSWLPDEGFTAGVTYEDMPTPARVVQYFGPIAPDLVWLRQTQSGDTADYRNGIDVFTRGDARTEQVFDEPRAPGAALPLPDVLAAQPGKWTGINAPAACSFCRQGDTFYPFTYLTVGSSPLLRDGPYGFDPSATHLYREDGTEVPQSRFLGGYPVYKLPPEKARYRFTVGSGLSWTFTSSRPTSGAQPMGTGCWATIYLGSTDPCAADPLLFLRYDASTDLDNAVTAPAGHMLRITPYYQADTAPARVTSLKIWTSTDGGTTWKQAIVHADPDGGYTAMYTVPLLSATDGHVSIKAQATDSTGGTVSEILPDAYALTGTR
ncbi:PA domain-containing protein [Actinoallomurus iriomotensis]|uniref:PA domain-containing protein n=1 Tax=Actinoallomurus iriomotensis TaxID=478107 RepID=A0A9W6W2E7_9ACTN|nr:PA domain-containing protein [Actinoallomurus iriomotensis]GLY88374.1 hypothetical protein Airi02_063030 [Actinoallomurus iriomotensis]